jgi:MATE family multidrug resistance protein
MLEHLRRIVALAWPVLVGQLAIIAFGVIDTAMVGRYSADDLAALGLGSSVYISVYIGLTGIVVALSPIAGQLFGAGRSAEIGEEVRQTAWLAALLTVVGFALLYHPEPLLRIAHAPAALHERTVGYLRLLSFGLPASLCFRIYSSLSNAVARPRMVMLVQVVGLCCKIPLNAWFIFGGLGLPPMGGPGCALATTLLNWMSAAVGVVIVARHPFYRRFGVFERFSKPDARRQMALLRLGLPMGLSYLIEVTSYTFMALFIARFGTAVLAGHQIAGNLGAVLYMTPLSIGIACSTLVAQALGARQAGAARALALHGIAFAVSFAVVAAALLVAFHHAVIDAYTPDTRVALAATPLVLIVAAYHIFDALQVSTAFILRAYKVAVVPTVIYAVALWGVGLGGGYLLGFNAPAIMPLTMTGAAGFWIANSASLLIAGIGLFSYLLHVSRARR